MSLIVVLAAFVFAAGIGKILGKGGLAPEVANEGLGKIKRCWGCQKILVNPRTGRPSGGRVCGKMCRLAWEKANGGPLPGRRGQKREERRKTWLATQKLARTLRPELAASVIATQAASEAVSGRMN